MSDSLVTQIVIVLLVVLSAVMGRVLAWVDRSGRKRAEESQPLVSESTDLAAMASMGDRRGRWASEDQRGERDALARRVLDEHKYTAEPPREPPPASQVRPARSARRAARTREPRPSVRDLRRAFELLILLSPPKALSPPQHSSDLRVQP